MSPSPVHAVGTSQPAARLWHSQDLESLFQACFLHSHNTRLQGGAAEPFYRPAQDEQAAQVLYREDFFRSALHEIAHWCVAGPQRRQLEDYGYWYAPDGRDANQQAEFERVEVLPQALELIFCAACGHPFRISIDNLDGAASNAGAFERAVLERAQKLLAQGLASRSDTWALALSKAYRGELCLRSEWLSEVFVPSA